MPAKPEFDPEPPLGHLRKYLEHGHRIAAPVEVGGRAEPGADAAEIILIDIRGQLPLAFRIDLADLIAAFEHLPWLQREGGQPPADRCAQHQRGQAGADHRQAFAQLLRGRCDPRRLVGERHPRLRGAAFERGDARALISEIVAHRIDRGAGDDALVEQYLLLREQALRLGLRVARIGQVARAVLTGVLDREALAAGRAQLSGDVRGTGRDVEFERRVGKPRERCARRDHRAIGGGKIGDLPARNGGDKHGAQRRDLGTERHEITKRRTRYYAGADRGGVDGERMVSRHQPPQGDRHDEHRHADRNAHDHAAAFGVRALDAAVHGGAGKGRLRHAAIVPDMAVRY